MAKAAGYTELDRQVQGILRDVKDGVFKPVYLLMGDEPYFTDSICDAIIDHALREWERDFNETICYGSDVTAEQVITAARRFPMMAERQLVVVKEAQAMKELEQLSIYCENPLDSTILVLLLRGASADKRKALYKSVLKIGTVVESNQLRDYEVPRWIADYYAQCGLTIDPDAAVLLAESAGTDLSKIALETEKMRKNLAEGTRRITAADVERNVGISRAFSIFELTRELSSRNAKKALQIAAHIGEAPRFAMPMAVSALFLHFYRILKYEALLQSNPHPDAAEKAKILGNPYFFRKYEQAAANYPLPRTMAIIALLNEYDYKGKGGDATDESTPGQLLVELVAKILNS